MLARFRCIVCGYVYQPDAGDPVGSVTPGTPFEDVPVDWRCPVCAAPQEKFFKDEPICLS